MSVFDLLFRKQRRIEAMVFEYLDAWEACLARFKVAMDLYLEKGLGEEFSELVEQTHRLEAQADDVRRKIEHEMYAKALLPESRGDILGFLENLDRVPNKAETVLFILSGQGLQVPREFLDDLRRQLAPTHEAIDLLLRLARGVFAHNPKLEEMVRAVDEKESASDAVEREVIPRIFSSDLDGLQKLTLRDLVLSIGDITDHSENIADRMMIMSLKRRV